VRPYRELAGDRRFRCKECGALKRVKYVPVSDICRACARKGAQLRNPMTLIQLAPNTIITSVVERKLRKRATKEIQLSSKERILDASGTFSILIIFPCAYLIANAISDNPQFYFWLGPACVIQALWMEIVSKLLVKPRAERQKKVADRIMELAEIRIKAYEEATRFYTSPEWIALRKLVIQEDGRTCTNCGKAIMDDFDVTVDHKKPRVRYPTLALSRENLRILCRKCNSRKGAREPEYYY
jgi:hypothetical protein